MTDLDPLLTATVLKLILKIAAHETLKPEFEALLRQHVVNMCSSTSPRIRMTVLEDCEAALNYWLIDFLAEPKPTFTYTNGTN
jgi:hypothetical protein